MSNLVEDVMSGRVSADELRDRISSDVEVARKRLSRMTRRRPFLSCGIALAAGYMTGRLITRW